MSRNAEKNTEKREVVSGKNTRQKRLNQEICGMQRQDRRKAGEGEKKALDKISEKKVFDKTEKSQIAIR
jgi:surface antigen